MNLLEILYNHMYVRMLYVNNLICTSCIHAYIHTQNIHTQARQKEFYCGECGEAQANECTKVLELL